MQGLFNVKCLFTEPKTSFTSFVQFLVCVSLDCPVSLLFHIHVPQVVKPLVPYDIPNA